VHEHTHLEVDVVSAHNYSLKWDNTICHVDIP